MIGAGEIHNIFWRLEESSMNKIGKVVEYARSEECKRKFILNYFGEEYSGECNACSVCNPFLKIDEGIKAKEELEDSLREKSDKSTKIASNIFELLKDCTADEVIDIIDQLIEKGYLIKKQGSSNFPRPLLYLTELAEKALEEKIPIDLRLPAKKKSIGKNR